MVVIPFHTRLSNFYMQKMEEIEARSLTSLLSGFQGSLDNLLFDTGDPSNCVDISCSLGEQPEHSQAKRSQRRGSSSRGEVHSGRGTRIQKRVRNSSEPISSQHGPDDKPKKATPRELTKLLQSKLSLLDEQKAENENLRARCRILEKVGPCCSCMHARSPLPNISYRKASWQLPQPLTMCTSRGDGSSPYISHQHSPLIGLHCCAPPWTRC